MENRQLIYQKIEGFIKKYYVNELVRGSLFFVGLGLLYFLATLIIEHYLWLKPMGRTILFWTFIVVELYLLFRFVVFPLFKLFKLQKGIGYEEASSIIGRHFAEVSDKLTNFLQLANSDEQQIKSELLMASIEQKAKALQPIPFKNAINYSVNKKFFPLALIPFIVIALLFMSGNSAMISQSFNRVIHYNAAFLPPAPFKFVIVNRELQTEQGKDFIVRIKTEGNIVPEKAMIIIDNESYFMESSAAGLFQYKVSNPARNLSFHIEGNSVSSAEYELKVISVPTIANFEMQLNFPPYLNKKQEIIKGTGNANIPEGTIVTWRMDTQATSNVLWQDDRSMIPFVKSAHIFTVSKNIMQNIDYQIVTSNENVKNHEKLKYKLTVIKDQFPAISVNYPADSLKINGSYLIGQISDDYALSKLQIVYYQKDRPDTAKRGTIPIKKSAVDRFVFSFPSNLSVEQGIVYDYYFEVYDNDAIHNYKSARSAIFSNRVSTIEEKEDLIFEQQNDNISGFEKSLKNQDKQISIIEKLQKIGKEKENLDFNDQQKVNDFINRQMKQDEMMKDFTQKMNDNLDQIKSEKKDQLKEELQKRMDAVEKELQKNKKLLDELRELNNKIQNEEVLSKLDKFKQNSKNQTKNLEQLVELTKRYYVQKKVEQLGDKLSQLADKQDKLITTDEENKTVKQDKINDDFERIKKELDELERENKELKSPLDIPNEAAKKESIKTDLNKASEQLKKGKKEQAKPNQKNAAKKMKELSVEMAQSMEGAEMEQLQEDVAMMRQILDNLLAFSLSQEELMKQFKKYKSGSPGFNKNIKIQQDLKLQFKHVDDSLFAMSLRNPKIADDITKEIGNVTYNIDKALSNLTEAQVVKGVSHQQYTIAASNKLADFLSDLLNSMQMEMSGMSAGKLKLGQGQGMQLPDIIKKQQGIGDKMGKGLEGKKPGDGQNGQVSKPAKAGDGAQEGEGSEGDAQAVMDIYKEQRQLRDALEMMLEGQGGAAGRNIVDQMKQIEKQLINKGFKNETLQNILNVKQELLKLKTAVQQQGEENKRQAESNKKDFDNQSKALPSSLQDYLNSIEILNRQSLPLRSNFNQKVQEYFNKK